MPVQLYPPSPALPDPTYGENAMEKTLHLSEGERMAERAVPERLQCRMTGLQTPSSLPPHSFETAPGVGVPADSVLHHPAGPDFLDREGGAVLAPRTDGN